jgi:hypothetical protein
MPRMSSNVIAAPGTTSRRSAAASGRLATVVALLGVLLVVAAVVLFVPVAPTTAAGTQLVTETAAEQFVQDAHVQACPGPITAVTCSAVASGWSCRWADGATRVARTPDPGAAVPC